MGFSMGPIAATVRAHHVSKLAAARLGVATGKLASYNRRAIATLADALPPCPMRLVRHIVCRSRDNRQASIPLVKTVNEFAHLLTPLAVSVALIPPLLHR